jgi:hypothetical protein
MDIHVGGKMINCDECDFYKNDRCELQKNDIEKPALSCPLSIFGDDDELFGADEEEEDEFEDYEEENQED